MSTDDKKNKHPETDGLAELMNAFGGYSEDIDEDPIEVLLIPDDEGTDGSGDVELELPEIPSDVSIPEDWNIHDGFAGAVPTEQGVAREDNAASSVVDSSYESFDVPSDILDVMNSTPVPDKTPPEESQPKHKKNSKIKKIHHTPVNDMEAAMADDEPVKAKEPKTTEPPKGAAIAEPVSDPVPAASVEKEKKPKIDKPAKALKQEKKQDSKDIPDQLEPEEKLPTASPARLVITLMSICAVVALLLGTVNHITAAKITENTRKEMLLSIQKIFDETVQAEEITLPDGSELTSAYLVVKNGSVCGYSASVAPAGFSGAIDLMVGIDHTGAVVGVEVVNMSETPGLGSKVGNADFLTQFTGKSGEIGVDAISGATISSKAVAAGVNSVTSELLDIEKLAAERGMTVAPFDPTAVPVITETVTEAPAAEESTAAIPEAPETTAPDETTALPVAPQVTKGDSPPQIIVDNPNDENPGIDADFKEDTTEFETLTTEPETTETEETEEPEE